MLPKWVNGRFVSRVYLFSKTFGVRAEGQPKLGSAPGISVCVIMMVWGTDERSLFTSASLDSTEGVLVGAMSLNAFGKLEARSGPTY